MPIRASCFVALICAVAYQGVLAERSRLDDDVDIVERGDCEVETTWQRRTLRGEAPERETALRLSCGIGWGTELDLPLARTRSAGARDDALGVEGKTSVRERRLGLGVTFEF